jgi:hypothetical protein
MSDDFGNPSVSLDGPKYTAKSYLPGSTGFVSSTDKDYANKTLANIERTRFADYMERYPKIHQQYLDMTMNPDFTLEQVDRVQGTVYQSFGRAKHQNTATLGRMGVQSKAKDNGIAQSLAVAHGENSVRQNGSDRQITALAGGTLPSLQTQTGG